jgi:ATP-binding cassette subfamily F protein 3
MFQDNLSNKKINVLSGGEKSRVMLGKILINPANLLLLDEPTNHLDLDSCDSLLAAIKDFDGAVLMVTHDEYFLREVANKLIVFDDDRVSVFEGTYNDFLEKVGWTDEY